ncbi:autotransporter domain-containing protein [Campylobacter sp. 9BO]|uniref:autotransporter domain-containing protein n=1 Tax=Campylobacter sp. 9BO TaxID=3424759 RepID=UPI003D328CFB
MKFSKIACIAIMGVTLSTNAFAGLKEEIVKKQQFQSELDVVQSALKSDEQDLASKQKQKVEKQAELDDITKKKQTTQEEIEAVKKLITDAENNHAIKEKEVAEANEKKDEAIDKATEDENLKQVIAAHPQTKELEKLKSELDELSKLEDFKAQNLEDLRKELDNIQEKLGKAAGLLTGQEERVQRIRQAVGGQQDDSTKDTLDIINVYITEIKNEAKKNHDKLTDEVINEISESAQKAEQIGKDAQVLRENLEENRQKQQSLEKQQEAVEERQQTLQDEKQNLERLIQETQQKIEQGKNSLEKTQKDLEGANQTIEEEKKKLGDTAKQEEKKVMYEILDDNKKDLAQKEAKLKEKEAKLKKAKDDQQKAEAELKNTKDELAKKIDEIIDPGVLSQENKTLEGLSKIVENLKDVQKITEADKNTKDELKQQVSATLNLVKKDIDENLQDLHKKLDEIQKTLDSVDDSNVEEKKTEINKSIAELKELAKQKGDKINNAGEDIQELGDNLEKQEQEAQDAKQKAEAAQNEIERQLEPDVQDAKDALQNAKNGMKDVGVFVDAKNKQEEQVAEALFDKGVMTRKTPDSDIVAISDSLGDASDNIYANAPTKITKFNSELSTKTRLAKLSNPFNENLALAYAINNLKGDAFADSGDTLGSVVRTYTDRYKYDNNLWANAIGAKASLKNDAKAKMYGFSLGYDKVFDDTIVGGFTTLAKSKHEDRTLTNKANNYEVGVYARHFMYNHEIDTKVSFGVAKNKTNRSVVLSNGVSKNDGKYTSKFASFDLNYGYVFDLTNAAFIKPTVGLSYLWLKNGQLKENGNLPININAKKYKELTLNLSTEIRKYVADGSYFYIQPGFEREIYKAQDDASISFVGSKNNIVFDKDKSKKGYFTLQTGAEFAITPTLSTNINFGLKTKEDEKYYSGTFGVRYKF